MATENKTDSSIIDWLVDKNLIVKENPFWWDLHHSDPREYVTHDEFKKRLVSLGPTKYPCCEYVYVGEKVPITVVNIHVDGREVPLFVTVCPFTPKEDPPHVHNRYEKYQCNQEQLLQLGRENREIMEKTSLNLPRMFHPHARGFFKERRGDTFFYYPTFRGMPEAISAELPHISFFNGNTYGIHTIEEKEILALRALLKKGVVHSKKTNASRWSGHKPWQENIPFGGTYVPYDEFEMGSQTVSFYPVKIDDVASFPVAITREDNQYMAHGVFLGYKDQGNSDLRVVRFTNPAFAQKVKGALERELNILFKAQYLERKPGKSIIRTFS